MVAKVIEKVFECRQLAAVRRRSVFSLQVGTPSQSVGTLGALAMLLGGVIKSIQNPQSDNSESAIRIFSDSVFESSVISFL